MQGVILAAGKGTRLQPLTLTRSKAMAPVAGQPLVARVADLLVHNGVDQLIVVANPLDQELHEYVRAQGLGAAEVRLVMQHERLGMAHALGLAQPWLHEPFVMSACDNLVAPEHVGDLIRTHQAAAADATLSLLPVDLRDVAKTGVVVWEPPYVRKIVEKPKPEEAPSNISSLPLYLFGPALLALLPQVTLSARGEYELQDAIQLLIAQGGKVLGVQASGRLQVTNAADLLALNLTYLAGQPSVVTGTVAPDVVLRPPVLIEAGATVRCRGAAPYGCATGCNLA
jgi:glucose-1-phosphate thymidylyltransferase